MVSKSETTGKELNVEPPQEKYKDIRTNLKEHLNRLDNKRIPHLVYI